MGSLCPSTSNYQHQIREFLGAQGFCHIWISNCSYMAKSLYKATNGEGDPLLGKRPENDIQIIKDALTQVYALKLPDITKPFFLYVHEQKPTGYRCPNTSHEILSLPGDILVKTVRLCSPKMAYMDI